MLNKRYFFRVITVALLLSAVIISSAVAFLLSAVDEEIGNGNFLFSVLYSVAWCGIILSANIKAWKTLRVFSVCYLGLNTLLFLLLTVLTVCSAIKLPTVLSLVMVFELYPFLGWSHVMSGIALPIFCLALTACMTAAVLVPLIRRPKNK